MNNFTKEELKEILIDLKPELDSTGNDYIINCPECGQRECKISIKKQGHVFGCFRMKKCGVRGNIWNILKKLGKLKLLFKEFKGEVADHIDISKLSIIKQDVSEEDEEVDLNAENKTAPIGWTRTFDDPYLKQRNFNSYEHCFVGRTNMHPKVKKDYVVFLVKENQEIKGWVGRHVWDKKDIEEYNNNYFLKNGIKDKIKRYNNSDHTSFSKLLYGIDELDENNPVPVCLVEGIFDKHAIDEKLYLHEDPFMKTIATFKCFITDTQIAKLKLKNVKDIILFYDPDVIKAIQINVRKLVKFFNVKIIISNQDKDPDELTQEELIQVFENHIYTPDQIKNDFLQINNLIF